MGSVQDTNALVVPTSITSAILAGQFEMVGLVVSTVLNEEEVFVSVP